MAGAPTLTDYVSLIIALFERFKQARGKGAGVKLGRPFTYAQEAFIIFFLLMQYRQIHTFKAQRRWLEKHPAMLEMFGWTTTPARTTISRRYKALYTVLQEFILFIGQDASPLGEQFSTTHLVEDKSLFKALGPVWHQSDRQAGRIPEKLRKLDTDATWSKSAYHGWVYGYAAHVTCNEAAFPVMARWKRHPCQKARSWTRKSKPFCKRCSPQPWLATMPTPKPCTFAVGPDVGSPYSRQLRNGSRVALHKPTIASSGYLIAHCI